MNGKLLAGLLVALLLGGVAGRAVEAKHGKADSAAAYAKGRGDGCSVAVELLTPFGKEIGCAVEADGALYLEGEMVKGGKVNLDAALAKALAQ